MSSTAKNVRLYCKARHLGYQRGKHLQTPKTSLVQIEGVINPTDAAFYMGKRVGYVYKASKTNPVRGSRRNSLKEADKKNKTRVIWGKITRVHGNSGVVRAKFAKALPPRTFGASLRVMLFPSNI